MLVVPEKEPRLGSSSARLVATCGQLVAKAKEKGQGNYSPDLRFHGRDDWIRTSGLTVPNRARYQTAPRPDIVPYVNSPEGTSPVSPNDRLRTPVDRPSTPSESDERQLPQARSARVCGHFCGHAVARLWPQALQRAVYLRLIGFWELGSETAFPSSRTERSTKLSHEPLRSITLPDSRRL